MGVRRNSGMMHISDYTPNYESGMEVLVIMSAKKERNGCR